MEKFQLNNGMSVVFAGQLYRGNDENPEGAI